MMTSSNGNIFHVTEHLCGEFIGDRWIPHTKASARSFDVSLICVWINGWVNNREAGDFKRYRAHYDVTVMIFHGGGGGGGLSLSLFNIFDNDYAGNGQQLAICMYSTTESCSEMFI